ncbi:Hypothetical protein PFCIRM513_04265 [Propionibacterium freudenreichii]|uniref:Lipoprotein n=1 Tax=Propionibacterium freudenreichii TaxID=1744 RepID=A0A2C7YQW3_9ACTN|nr:hypothetical protein [Propionibacterium freudenreichii]MCT2977260.1 hypothetical protein [Propionibacterium freudenreichii]MCT2983398.1 hypothetical protein [Propionibacterium freudenreichii]MCT2994636.1 hypothetical protein [Propionibacterium freudenreichii]MDK9322607.1 hypothetical protein [Propionibacterium freudenreichii]MDK9324610.1 hypothetical protein [Propionibacterium freudenreichii]
MSKRSLLVRIGVPAAALAMFAGCSPSPATAIELDGARVSESTITRYADGCSKMLDAGGGAGQYTPGDIRRVVVSYVGEGMIADQLAREYGVTLSDSDMDQAKQAPGNARGLLADNDCAQAVDGQLRLTALVLSAKGKNVQKDAASLAPVVNPRYGAWSPTDFAVAGTGSLSKLSTDR